MPIVDFKYHALPNEFRRKPYVILFLFLSLSLFLVLIKYSLVLFRVIRIFIELFRIY